MTLANPERNLSHNFMEMLMLIHVNIFRNKHLPLPLNQYGLLMVIHTEGPITNNKASEILNISKQQMSSVAERLLQLGYISKSPDEKDRRRCLLKLTDKGLDIIADQNTYVRNRFDANLANLSKKEQERLDSAIGCLKDSLEAMFAKQG